MTTHGALMVMVGAQGSGKSQLIAARVPDGMRFSLDAFRLQLSGDVASQDATTSAVAMLDTLLEYRLSRGLFCAVDATHARPAHRDRLRRIADRHDRPTVAVLMHTPLQVCLNRSAQHSAAPYPGANGTPVPADVVRRTWFDIDQTPPTSREFQILVHVHPTDPARLIAETRQPRDWAKRVLAEHGIMPDATVIPAGWPVPWMARV